jgi:hypothetical protein
MTIITLSISLQYNKTISNDHKIVWLEIYKRGNGLNATGFDVPNNSWDFADISLTNGAPPEGTNPAGSYVYDERRLSYFSRVQYDFKGKYLLSGMLRRDSSTRFGPGNKVGYFFFNSRLDRIRRRLLWRI